MSCYKAVDITFLRTNAKYEVQNSCLDNSAEFNPFKKSNLECLRWRKNYFKVISIVLCWFLRKIGYSQFEKLRWDSKTICLIFLLVYESYKKHFLFYQKLKHNAEKLSTLSPSSRVLPVTRISIVLDLWRQQWFSRQYLLSVLSERLCFLSYLSLCLHV